MKIVPSTLAALAALLACKTGGRATAGATAEQAQHAANAHLEELAPDAPPEAVLPGVDLAALTPGQRQELARWARTVFCYCGCPHRLADCLRVHGACKHAPRVAALGGRYAAFGLAAEEIRKQVDAYYASFDRRVRLDVVAFGPAFEDAKAPLTLVEFSDFTCPFCQRLRPALEKWAAERTSRVALYYKPFPIETHEHALEAAQAGEWARDAGVFWKMHDLLFANTDHSLDALAEAAREAGGDEADLRDALVSGKYLPKVRASQAEGRAADLRGTPTLYLGGRRLELPEYSDDLLDFTVEDEAEWQANKGWARD
jgi:protein-disulfide isomerase